MGILGGAGVVFFAFIGFDAVSTAAQEAKNPKRDMPIGILGSLVICTVLYVLFSHVLSGVATVEDFRTQGKEASVAFAIETYMTGYGWLAKLVTIAILAGFSSVILVMLLGQSRVFYSMSRDGLVPKVFSEVHPVHRRPPSHWLFFVFTSLFAAFVPDTVVITASIVTLSRSSVVSCMDDGFRPPEISRVFPVPFCRSFDACCVTVADDLCLGSGHCCDGPLAGHWSRDSFASSRSAPARDHARVCRELGYRERSYCHETSLP